MLKNTAWSCAPSYTVQLYSPGVDLFLLEINTKIYYKIHGQSEDILLGGLICLAEPVAEETHLDLILQMNSII